MDNEYFSWFCLVLVYKWWAYIFIRTRSSIKFYAKFITILNVIFIFYMNSYMYAAHYQCLYALIVLTIAILLAFLEYFEILAILDWNPSDINTPSL